MKGRLKVDRSHCIVLSKLGSKTFMEDGILPANYDSVPTPNWKGRGFRGKHNGGLFEW